MGCLRVLLIDDDAGFLALAEGILSSEKYSVTSVGDFGEAAAHLRRMRGRTVVLSELTVGKQSGLAFLEDTLRRYPILPFTFLSKSPPLESVIEALKKGAYDFLRKPVPPDILLHSVARSVEKLNLSLEAEKLEKDTSEQMSRLEADLKSSKIQNAYAGFLVSMAGHDFKSILTVLDGYFQILKEKCSDCKRTEPLKLMGETVHTILRLRTMASTLLDFEAAQRGQLLTDNRPFDLDTLLKECAVFYRPYAEQKRVTISVEAGLPRLIARGDSDRVLQVLDNLIYNAIKFTPPEGEIRIGARTDEGKSVTAWVQDTGAGIPKPELDRIFTDKRVADTRNACARIGLGLNICKKLLEVQNGKIWLESEPGKGTKVYFSLPL
jgi:signal transduction histidine kinase